MSPHPDDVYSAWGMVQHSSDNYPVFITLTAGEHTGYCAGQSVTISGYATYPSVQRDQTSCKQARMTSLKAWLDDQASRDTTLDNLKSSINGVRHCFTPQSATVPYNTNNGAQYNCATYIIGSKSARVEFDLGDGNLTTSEVNWAIKNVRSHRSYFPVTKEYGVVADAYYNKTYTGCGVYTHPDHYAVQSAIFHTNQFPDLTSGNHPQVGVTCASDPDYQASHYSKTILASDYAANMKCPTGIFQTRFHWLAFSGANGCWAYGTESSIQHSSGAVFASDEYFWIQRF